MTDLSAALSVRPAGIADLDAVTAVISESYVEYARSLPPDMWAVYRSDMLDVRDLVTEGRVLVAEHGGGILGSVVFTADGTADHPPWSSGTAALRLLAVRPDARGRGIARLLVDACVARARDAGATALGLHTATFMASATRLYAALGFLRAPELDFDAFERFGVARGDGPEVRGLAMVLPLR